MNCSEARQQLSDALAHAAEPGDVRDLEAHLADCDGCRGMAVDLYRQDRLLLEELAAPRLPKLARRIHARLDDLRPKRGGLRWAALLALAASLLLAVAAWMVFGPRKSHHETVALADAQGEVVVLDASGQRQPAGAELTPGQIVRTSGESSSAAIRFADSTRFTLGADTSLELVSQAKAAGKSLLLMAGTLAAEVAAQPADRPVVISTPHAEVIVRGTRFRLVTSADSTHVDVQEGSVEFRSKSSRQAVEVRAGGQATAAQGLELRVIRDNAQIAANAGVRAAFFLPNDPHVRVVSQMQAADGATITHMGDRTATRLATPATHLIRAAAVSPDGKVLASGGIDAVVHLWDPGTGEHRGELRGHEAAIRAVAFSPDRKTLASSDDRGIVRLWDVAEQKQLGSLGQVTVSSAGAPAFSPDGRLLAVANPNARETVRLFDVATMQPTRIIGDFDKDGRRIRRATCVAFAPDGKTLALGVAHLGSSPDGSAIVPEGVRRGVDLYDLDLGSRKTLFETRNEVWAVTYSPDGAMLAVACNNLFNLWSVPAGHLLAQLEESGTFTAAAFSGDGRRVAGVDTSRTTLALWEMAD
jgi:ferric-dicitrate binding protein FerR (iron transport regulator)